MPNWQFSMQLWQRKEMIRHNGELVKEAAVGALPTTTGPRQNALERHPEICPIRTPSWSRTTSLLCTIAPLSTMTMSRSLNQILTCSWRFAFGVRKLLRFLITTDELQFTYGVLAFRKWIKEKNSELALSTKSAKPFKTDILQLSTEELNYTLCMFVKEVRKPDGDEYAPDIIFYLCLGKLLTFIALIFLIVLCGLGIQLYLYRSGRVDNIFTDAFYEKFTECLNLVSLKFVSRLSDRGRKQTLTKVGSDDISRSSADSRGGGASLGKSAAGSALAPCFALYPNVLQHKILLFDWSRGPHETFIYSCDEALEEEQYSARQIRTKQKCPAPILSSSSSAWYVSNFRNLP